MEKSEPVTICTMKLSAIFIMVHPLFPYLLFKFTSLHSFKAKLDMKMQIWAWSKYCNFCIPKGLCKCLLATPLRRHFVNIGWYSTSLKQFLNLKWTSAYSSKPSQLTRFNWAFIRSSDHIRHWKNLVCWITRWELFFSISLSYPSLTIFRDMINMTVVWQKYFMSLANKKRGLFLKMKGLKTG